VDLKRAVIDLAPAPIVRLFASPYIAGKGIDSGVQKADELWQARHVHSTIDLLGEEVFRREDVEATVAVYLQIFQRLSGRPHVSVSLKPTQLGVHESEAYCLENVRRILADAAARGIQVTVDMEDRSFTDVTLRLFRALRDEFDNVGVVLQSRLFRTRDDVLSLHARPCRVRICIGIYREPREIAHVDKPIMKEKLFEYVQLLLDKGHYPEIATHDEPLVRRCIEYLEKRGCPPTAYEFQMLLGVPRDAIQTEMVRSGRTVRLYVPFAEEWEYAIAYCKRRLAANPMMGAYVMKNLLRP
jgi:proline dehydrogenase